MSAIQTITEINLFEKKTKIISPIFKEIFFINQQNAKAFEFYVLEMKYSPAMNKKSIIIKTEKK